MHFLPFFVLVFLSIFSTGIMSYISMATPIGPWIEPTIVLFATIIFGLFYKSVQASTQNMTLTIIGSSIGGILATALGFSLPTLFFLDAELFNSWMMNPIFFSCAITALSLSASLFGYCIADMVEHKFIIEQQLAFPIGQLVHKMIAAKNQMKKAKELAVGFLSTLIFCIFQDGFFGLRGFLPKVITIINPLAFNFLKFPALRLDIFPIYWAIGFVTGHVIAIPLFVGALSKIFIVDSLNGLFFPNISGIGFVLAFSSGMVLSSAIFGFIDAPKIIYNVIRNIISGKQNNFFNKNLITNVKMPYLLIIVLLINFVFLTYFKFTVITQFYILFFTLLCTYQITNIAGKIGLAQLGRFATFVMIPAMFIFNLNFIQLTFIAAFVEICGGVATDVLFGRKVAQLSEISSSLIKKYQLLGIIISCFSVGVIFWLLINQFSLGSDELFAQKAQSRALLINAINFDHYVLALGFIFGIILKYININSMLVLGGLLMPIDISIGLIIGAIFAHFTKNKEEWVPFWSGVFASHSIWMLIQAIL